MQKNKKKQTMENENANNCGRRVLDSFFFDNRENRTQLMKVYCWSKWFYQKRKETNMSKWIDIFVKQKYIPKCLIQRIIQNKRRMNLQPGWSWRVLYDRLTYSVFTTKYNRISRLRRGRNRWKNLPTNPDTHTNTHTNNTYYDYFDYIV